MLRKLLTVILPFLLPFLVYGFYLMLQKWRAQRSGKQAPGGWAAAPWSLILLAAVLLVAISLVTYRFTVETQWEDPPVPSVTGSPETLPAGEGVIRPEDRPTGQEQEPR